MKPPNKEAQASAEAVEGRARTKENIRQIHTPPAQDGRERPLGIAALEDKIVQQAVVTILNEIYEADFRGFSYGFRPGRGPHPALDALNVGIQRKRVNWILDADIRGFFDTIPRAELLARVQAKVSDGRMLTLLQAFLTQGVLEEMNLWTPEAGTPRAR